MTRCTCLFALVLAAAPAVASARADIVADLQGSGFAATRRVRPVGGNAGTTLGEQRRLALEYAFGLWGSRIDSDVPIAVSVEFDEQGCEDNAAVLGSAGPTKAFAISSGSSSETGMIPDLLYPSALADSLAGYDLDPGHPDIVVILNSSLDEDCKSLTGGFYYGFDGRAGDAQDFVHVVLHEFAHGLGFTSLWDPDNGDFPNGLVDAFSANIRDLDLDAPWSELTSAQRLQSATNARRVAWDGPEAAQLVPSRFGAGTPALTFDPPVRGFSGLVSDTSFGESTAAAAVMGTLYVAPDCNVPRVLDPRTVVLFPPLSALCSPEQLADASLQAGAAGALLVMPMGFDRPAMPVESDDPTAEVELPVISLSERDADLIRAAASQTPLMALLGGDPARRLGADAEQRPLLFVTSPYSQGSSISHLEQLVRPSELMEPYAFESVHELAFTVAMLRDVGWSALCGDGSRDVGEACDDGGENDDVAPGACRTDCTVPRCGDGVRDPGEACDQGADNHDTRRDACRTTCQRPSCGDGVIDENESCDRGASNSDQVANACRMSCTTPRCGDGVLDALEQCDEGSANGQRPNTCRSGCVLPRCGDGIVDDAEDCDGEPDCTAACEPKPTQQPPEPARERDRPDEIDAGVAPDDAGGAEGAEAEEPSGGGCGCRVATTRRPPGRTGWFGLCCLAWVIAMRRRVARKRREVLATRIQLLLGLRPARTRDVWPGHGP